MDLVRWGLLSTARINRRVIPAIRASRRATLVAVASRDLTTAQTYATDWQIPSAFRSYDTLLDSDQVDAIYISLPNHLHKEWSIRAMEAGKHVLCEKPLALSVEEVDAIIQASQKTGKTCTEAFMYRHHPQTKIAGEWVRSGRLGEVSIIRGAFHYTIQQERADGSIDVRLYPDYGGGCLWDIGVYPISFAQYVLNSRPLWVSGSQRVGEFGVDESFSGLLHYPGDCSALISASFRTPFLTFMDIFGAEGRLTINRPFVGMQEDRRMVFEPKEGKAFDIPVPEQDLYLAEIEDINAVILDGMPAYISLAESRDHIRTVTALYESAREHKTINLIE